MSPSSPRKTRSRVRLLSGIGTYAPGSDYAASDASPTHLAITPVPVMNASSMEPVHGNHSSTEKRVRHKMTELQRRRLEELYQANTHPSRAAKEDLAREIGMTAKSVLIWFQNRRQDRRRKGAAMPLSPVPSRSRATPGPQSHAIVLGKPQPPRRRQPKNVSVAAPGGKPASPSHRPRTSDTVRQPSPVHSARRSASSEANDSMDVDGSSPSTPPTSLHAKCSHRARVKRSPSSSLESSSSVGSPDALWRFIVRSPAPPPPLPLQAQTNGHDAHSHAKSARRPLGTIQGTVDRRKPDLEWACANSAARRKHGCFAYRDEDDSDGESSELEARLTGSPNNTRMLLRRRRWKQRDLKGSPTSSPPQVTVPREYELLFPPDVVLGASLLLTLKHSRSGGSAAETGERHRQ